MLYDLSFACFIYSLEVSLAVNITANTPFTHVEEDKSDNRVVLKYRDPGICVSIINLYCFYVVFRFLGYQHY